MQMTWWSLPSPWRNWRLRLGSPGCSSKVQSVCKHMRRSRIFFWGGGVQAWWPENRLDKFFFFFLVLNLFYSLQRGSNGFITEKTILFQGSRGIQHFSGGVSLFSRGVVQMLISIETHITCDFPGGGGGFRAPIPPLWIRTWNMGVGWDKDSDMWHKSGPAEDFCGDQLQVWMVEVPVTAICHYWPKDTFEAACIRDLRLYIRHIGYSATYNHSMFAETAIIPASTRNLNYLTKGSSRNPGLGFNHFLLSSTHYE